MARPRDRIRRSLRGSWAIGLAAVGLSAISCSRGPVTIVPRPLGGDWFDGLHRRYVERARRGHVDLLFLGDSITWGWNDNAVWKQYYEPRNAANFGVPGEATQHILWRIRHGELGGMDPRVAVLLIGTNNLSYCTPEEIALGITTVVQDIRDRLPQTRILLLGIFPRQSKPDAIREKLRAVNARIARLDDGAHVRFLDIGARFLNEDGTISPEIMPDYLHLSEKGYRIWADAMEPTLREMFDASR